MAILVEPPRLRNDAEILRQRASTVRNALEMVDQHVRSLSTDKFAGLAADSYRTSYQKAYQKLQHIDSILIRFATELETAAERFEQVDRNLANGGGGGGSGGGGSAAEVGANAATEAGQAARESAADSGRTGADWNNHINGFDVENNHRYQPNRDGNGYTYCNLYASDVAQRAGAPLPLFVPTEHDPNQAEMWLGATNMQRWLEGNLDTRPNFPQGPESGWIQVDATEAAQYANQGHVTIAAGHGHMAVVRAGNEPGTAVGDLMISQAGARNFNEGTLSSGWGQFVGEAKLYAYVP